MNKCRFLLIIIAMMLVSVQVSADPINRPLYNPQDKTLTLSGNLPGASEYDSITIEVIRPNKTVKNITDYSKGSITEIFVIFCEERADSSGGYNNVIVNMDGCDTGEYTIRVYSNGIEKPFEYKYFYASLQAQKYFIDTILLMDSADDINRALDLQNKDSIAVRILAIEDSVVFEVDSEALSKILYKIIKGIGSNDPVEFLNIIKSAAQIEMINEGKVKDILTYKNEFVLDHKFVDTYNKKVTDAEKLIFTKSLSGFGFTSITELQNKFNEITILSVLNNPQNWYDYIYIIENYADYLNLDLSDYRKIYKKEKLAEKLNGSYPSIESFKTKFNSELGKILESIDDDDSDNSGGSDRGARSAYKSTQIFSPPVTLDQIAEKTAETVVFEDLTGHEWAKSSIELLASKNIIKGIGINKFGPNINITREEFLKMALLAFDIEIVEGENSFIDANKNEWYYHYLSTALRNGLVTGREDGTFGVGQLVTREEMAAIAFRVAENRGIKFDTTVNKEFEDNNSISDFAKNAVYALNNDGIISGMGDNRFAPNEYSTRAEAAKIICGLFLKRGEGK